MPSETEKLIVGIDAGGTNVRIAVSGLQASADYSAPIVINAADDGGPEPLLFLLSSHTFDRNTVVSVAAGITKVSRTGVVDRWKATLGSLFPNAVVRVVPDFQIGFYGAVPGGVGVSALAGTGSVMYGENASGDAVRVGGRGWEYGDEGSGAWLTTEALRRVIRSLDEIDPMTPLGKIVCERLGEAVDAGQLAEAARRETNVLGRGFLVPLLAEQARLGDAEAANLFVGAAGWVGALVRTTLRRLSFETTSSVTIARVGGLWDVGPFLTEPFAQVIGRWYPHAVIIEAAAPPIAGAMRLAEQSMKPR